MDVCGAEENMSRRPSGRVRSAIGTGAWERLGVSAKGGQATPQKPARPWLPASQRPRVPPHSTYHVQRTTRHSATPASRSLANIPVMLTQTLTSCAQL
jgi:hypothetical protein